MDYSELYKILDDNNISYRGTKNNRDVAIKLILEFKKRKAKNNNGIIINDEDIINRYLMIGMDGIKTMFKRDFCYLYETEFVFNVLFLHYKRKWTDVENLIIKKIKND